MSENEQDPGASTERFRAYVADRQDTKPRSRAQSPLVLAAAGVLVLAAILVVWMLTR